MATRGRPKKQPLSTRIEDALGAAQQEIDAKLPIEIQKALVPEVLPPIVVAPPAPIISQDAQDDYDFARTNLHNLLMKGNEVLEGITELAKEGESPRTYEVAGGVLKVLIEGTGQLMQLQKDMNLLQKKIASDGDKNTPVSIEHADQVNNVILEGTTMEILEAIEASRKKKREQEGQ
jgi:hypothetical protein